MPVVKLRLQSPLTLPMEMKLVHDFGFNVVLRNKVDHYVEFGRTIKPVNRRVVGDDGLNEDTRNLLLAKVNKIVDHYRDPELHARSIRVRLNNTALCYQGVERDFILQWMEANVVDDQ